MSRLPTWLLCVALGTLVLGAYAWRLPCGVSIGDEAYYANFYVAWLRSPISETGDLSPHQPNHLLVFPLVKMYALLAPGLTGLMLFLRVVYALLSIGTALIMAGALSRTFPRPVALGVAATVIVFIPFSLPAPSYNTMGMLFSVCTACAFFRVFTSPAQEPVRGWLWAACLLGSLQTLAYPTLVFLPFMLAICCYAMAWREPWLARRFRAGLIGLTIGHVLVALLVVGVFGIDRLVQIAEFSQAYGVSFRMERKLALAVTQLRMGRFLIVCAIGMGATALLTVLRFRPWASLAHGCCMAALLWHLLRCEAPPFGWRSHGVVLFLAVAGWPVVRHVFARAASRQDRFLGFWYVISMLGGLLTSWTATNALLNFPVGAFGAMPAILLDWLRTPRQDVRVCWAPGLTWACVLLSLASGSATYFYGERGSAVSARISSGPLAGLRTAPERAKALEEWRSQISGFGSPDERVAFLSRVPGLYLFATMKLQTPFSWMIAPELEGLGPVLQRFYADRAHLPEYIIWHRPAEGAHPVLYDTADAVHPVQHEVLMQEYALVKVENEFHVYRRRDLLGSESPQVLTQGLHITGPTHHKPPKY